MPRGRLTGRQRSSETSVLPRLQGRARTHGYGPCFRAGAAQTSRISWRLYRQQWSIRLAGIGRRQGLARRRGRHTIDAFGPSSRRACWRSDPDLMPWPAMLSFAREHGKQLIQRLANLPGYLV